MSRTYYSRIQSNRKRISDINSELYSLRVALAEERKKAEEMTFAGTTPVQGIPGGWEPVNNGRTWRYYGDDGWADYDIDVDGTRGGGKKYPHQHEFDWSNKKKPRGGESEVTRPMLPFELRWEWQIDNFTYGPFLWDIICDDLGIEKVEVSGEEAFAALLAAGVFFATQGTYYPAY